MTTVPIGALLILFTLLGAASMYLIIRVWRIGEKPPVNVTVKVDWSSIKQGIEQDDRIVVRPIIDWNLVYRIAEVEGYTITRAPLQ